MALKVSRAELTSAWWSSVGGTFASVVRKPSIVAMFGLIMPAPLLMPVSVIDSPLIVTLHDAAFGKVSVVMIASAALYQLSSFRLVIACGNPATMRSTGNGSRMTPVENGRICDGSQLSKSANATQVALACPSPASPVPALALPVLTNNARIGEPEIRKPSRCALHTWTGAAQKRLVVNTPATVAVGASFITNTSLRLGLRMPASA